ncbi:c-type cytochrome [Psychrobacter sp. I-STPA10]|uniref:c-type cytochrome n=1 Tax=Psychrobacter sp. I-STPA10 TaxID=2585769 RepID=UPI001E2D6195|nr:c-type cytochrome [Psychrobacter sp. I-STPA10]
MKKVLILTAAAMLGMSSIAISQAEEVENAPAATEVSDAEQPAEAESTDADATEGTEAETEVDAEGSEEQDETAAIDAAEDIPQDTPQVQKLIALYPQLVARIQPYGRVCFEGEECDVTVTATGPSADGKPRDGEAVYNAVCHTCHATGLLGSPAFGDAGAWGPRIAKGKDTLYDHAINGFNQMPAKGGADIPDEEVQNAVDYMISAAS